MLRVESSEIYETMRRSKFIVVLKHLTLKVGMCRKSRCNTTKKKGIPRHDPVIQKLCILKCILECEKNVVKIYPHGSSLLTMLELSQVIDHCSCCRVDRWPIGELSK